MTLKQKYPDYNLVHFIDMYDDVITIEMHALNAIIFEDRNYVVSILKEINELELKKEEHLIVEYMNQCAWINEEERSVARIKKELTAIKDLKARKQL